MVVNELELGGSRGGATSRSSDFSAFEVLTPWSPKESPPPMKRLTSLTGKEAIITSVV